ncbi:hypothetical protein MNBD_ALPHA03-390 [hydrothermal vent metagenome]|uniref:DUF2927 domain-containing protein n=1 Tax=hydrothermal vent metagenome TaxID=652676 RepID=A0A3B1AZ81_9ZZZZ
MCQTNRANHAIMALLLAVFIVGTNPVYALGASNHQIIDGFNKTVFGAEYTPYGVQSKYIRKFRGTVKFYIHNRSALNRSTKVRAFIVGLNRQITGLKTVMVNSKSRANFNVFIVDRKDYVKTVQKSIIRRENAAAPGKCFVRTIFTPGGIVRSDAIIVSDEGENLFKRCMVEEILQGLGPLNEHTTLRESMFNDRSRHTSFTKFDRYILNMLYDPRVKVGTSQTNVQKLLPTVLGDIKKRF